MKGKSAQGLFMLWRRAHTVPVLTSKPDSARPARLHHGTLYENCVALGRSRLSLALQCGATPGRCPSRSSHPCMRLSGRCHDHDRP